LSTCLESNFFGDAYQAPPNRLSSFFHFSLSILCAHRPAIFQTLQHGLRLFLHPLILLLFFSSSVKNRKAEQVLPGRVGTGGRGIEEEVGKWWRVNMMQILCTNVCKWKNGIC
jgi:hypothetical protein